MSNKIERKLVAIMFTDIAGFTQDMSIDESKALSELEQKISVVKPMVEKFNGIYVKDIGDGTLSYFDSATHATDCALNIQTELNKDLDIRIGLHLGEVIQKDNDILGDSVNITSRIEKLSTKGGVFISSSIYDELKNKHKYNFQYLGLHSFKGVGRLLDIYGLDKSHSLQTSDHMSTIIDTYNDAAMPSISIIPFRNKGKTEDEFYSFSISSDIHSKLSSISNIMIPSIEDVENFLKTSHTSKQISKKLNTRYCLSGSLWKNKKEFNLTVELYDNNKGKTIWVDSWLEDWENLAAIESKISKNIIKILDQDSFRKLENEESVINSEAYKIYLKAKYLYHKKRNEDDAVIAESLFKQSIKIDAKLIQPRLLLGNMEFSRGDYDNALTMFEHTLEMSIVNKDDKNISASLSWIGKVYFQKGKYEKSLEYNSEALKIREKINNKKGMADSFNSIGAIHDLARDYSKALEFYQKALTIREKINDKGGIAMSMVNIANLHNTIGNIKSDPKSYDVALSIQRKCHGMCEEIENTGLLAYSFNLLGTISSNQSKYDKALRYLKKSLLLRQKLNDPHGISSAFNSIGLIYYRKGYYKHAMNYFDKSLNLREEIGYKVGIGESLLFIGKTFKKIGQYDLAADSFKRSLEIMEYLNDESQITFILNLLGNIYRKTSEYDLALDYLLRAKRLKEASNDISIGYTIFEISSIYRWQDNYGKALLYLKEAHILAKQHDQSKLIANCLYHESLISINQKKYSKATKKIEKAINIATTKAFSSNEAKYLDCLGIIHRLTKEFHSALEMSEKSLSISRMLGDKHGMRKYMNSIAMVKEAMYDFTGALELYSACLKIAKTIDEKRAIVISYNNIARIHENLDQMKLAQLNHKKAQSFVKKIKLHMVD